MMENRKLIDLSHTVEDGMITYKGLPPPVISEYLSREESRARYAEGTAFQIGKIEMVANTGTYLDSPFHRYSEGQDLSQLGLPSMANLEGLVVRAEGERKIGIELLENRDLQGKAILINTGWDR